MNPAVQPSKEEVFSEIIRMFEVVTQDHELANNLRNTHIINQPNAIATALGAKEIITPQQVIPVSRMLNSGMPIVPATLRARYEKMVPQGVSPAPLAESAATLPPAPVAEPVFSEEARIRQLAVIGAFYSPEQKIAEELGSILAKLGLTGPDGKPFTEEEIAEIPNNKDVWEIQENASAIIAGIRKQQERGA